MPETTDTPENTPFDELDGDRGNPARDDRRGEVDPADGPVPSSPAPDEDAVKSGEETLDRIKPY